MIRPFFYLQVGAALITTILIAILVGSKEAFSFGVGAVFAFLNTLVLVIIVSRIFAKKSVASSFFLIIFKYSVFGIGLYFLLTGGFLKIAWFVVGLSMLVMAVVGLTFIHYQQIKAEKTDSEKQRKERDDQTYGTF